MYNVVAFNGPPGSGKDFWSEYLRYKIPLSTPEKFSYPLKAIVPILIGEDHRNWRDFEEEKDSAKYFGYSFREHQIKLSEDYMKKHLGSLIFGKLMAKRMAKRMAKAPTGTTFIISDAGFWFEFLPVLDIVDKVMIVRLCRDGTTYDNDSRHYILKERFNEKQRKRIVLHSMFNENSITTKNTKLLGGWIRKEFENVVVLA